MAMPDAVRALRLLSDAPRSALTRQVYNVTAFSITAAEIRDLVLEAFPGSEITFVPDPRRQGIVDSWPADLNDNPARRDWDWEPLYDAERAFKEYLIPNIRKRYADDAWA
jgi:nucleoside-diphosphate-sugar epimerase